MNDKCIAFVEEKLDRKLKQDERQFLKKLVNGLQRKMEARPEKFTQEMFNKELMEHVKHVENALKVQKLNKLRNFRAQTEMLNYLKNNWSDDIATGFDALTTGTLVNRLGAQTNLVNRSAALVEMQRAILDSRITKAGYKDIVNSGQLDELIAKALHIMNSPKLDEKALMNLKSTEAVEIAKIYKDVHDAIRKRFNNAGGMIGQLEGFWATQHHDSDSLMKWAGKDIPAGDPRHMEAWVSYMRERLDLDKSLVEVPEEEIQKALENIFQRRANNLDNVLAKPTVKVSKAPDVRRIAKSFEHERVLHFKTFEDSWDYFKKAGGGDTLHDTLDSMIARMSRATAIMEMLGPAGKDNLEEVVAKSMQGLVDQGRGVEAKALQDRFRKFEKTHWVPLTENMTVPYNNTVSKWNSIARGLNSMNFLGSSVLGALPDMAFAGRTMRFTKNLESSDFFKGINDSLTYMIKSLGKKIGDDEKVIAAQFATVLDAINPVPNRHESGIDYVGNFSKFTSRLMRYTFLPWWTERMKLATFVMTGDYHYRNKDLSMTELPSGMRDLLRRYGIDEKGWDLIRSQTSDTTLDGKNILTVDGIKQLDLSKFEVYADSKTLKKLKKEGNEKLYKSEMERIRNEIGERYAFLMRDLADTVTSEPTDVIRNELNNGTKKGTLEGEALRHFWQFKTFGATVAYRHLGQELFSYSAEKMSTVKAMQKLFKLENKSGAEGLAHVIAVSAVLGYMSESVRSLTQGKTPSTPRDETEALKLFARSLARGGGLGIYSDFILGDLKNGYGQTPLTSFLGPTAGKIGDLLAIIGHATRLNEEGQKRGNREKAAIEAANFLMTTTPGIGLAKSHFLTRAAFDYLIYYRFKEMTNPGYLKRMEKRLDKQYNQQFIFGPPSEIIGESEE